MPQAGVPPQVWGLDQQPLERQPQGWVRGREQERGQGLRRALPWVPARALPSPWLVLALALPALQQARRCAFGRPG